MTRGERRYSGMSLILNSVSAKAILSRTLPAAAYARDMAATMAGTMQNMLQRTAATRSASVSTLALAGGAVFGVGLLAAMAPIASDHAPRLAAIDDQAVIHVASAAPLPAPAPEHSAQAALLPVAANTATLVPADPASGEDDIITSSTAPTPGSILRGSLAEAGNALKALNASFDEEIEDAQATELLEPPVPVQQTVQLEIESGDTLGRVLTNLGIPATDARAAVNALSKHFSPRELRVGQKLEVEIETTPVQVASLEEQTIEAPASLVAFSLKADTERSLRVTYNAETSGFESQEIFRELTQRVVRAEGEIEGSLFGSAAKLGVPNSVMVGFMKLYSYSVDFQREIRKGDKFEVYYTEFADEDGEYVKSGDILFASLQTGKTPMSLWRFEIPGENTVDYFDENGQSTKKFLMRTPIDGARISSTFGKRRHPILGYTKMHTGTDFAAPTGTPIYAAGNGTVVKAGWQGGYGKYVKIRHANGYETAYAHMSRIASGITPGARVSQGQTIGRVGTTGRSTGPHLHYEVHMKGKKVNPMTIRVPTGRKLEGKALTAFRSARDGMAAEMANVAPLKRIDTASASKADEGTSVE